MWVTAAKGLFSLLKARQKRNAEITELKHETKKEEIRHKSEMKKQRQTNDANADVASIEARKSTWLDEYLAILFTSPLWMGWFDFEKARNWVQFVRELPEWYYGTIILITAASFGWTRFVLPLFKYFFNKK